VEGADIGDVEQAHALVDWVTASGKNLTTIPSN
jgi:hypothetical protein